jgi:hypothetical protein
MERHFPFADRQKADLLAARHDRIARRFLKNIMTQDAYPQPKGWQHPDYIPIAGDQLKQCIVRHAEAIDRVMSNGAQIYRGVHCCVICTAKNRDSYTGFAFADGRYIDRKGHQADTRIHMFLLSGSMDRWHKYPPRNKSFCCICDKTIAAEWAKNGGAVHYVIPLEGQEVGMAPSQDLRYSFSTGFEKYLVQKFDTLYSFTDKVLTPVLKQSLEDVFQAAPEEQADKLAAVLKDLCTNKAKSLLSQMGTDPKAQDFLKKFVESGFETMYDFLNAILDPDLNGFQLITKERYEALQGHSKEVWFSGKVLMIDERFPVAEMKSHKELLEIAN